MVKIRLRRMGAKNRPFYRVVAKSTAARNGAFIENLGTYNPVVKPTHVQIDMERALYWLLQGAKPTETTAYLLDKVGVLERFFAERPQAKKHYAFLDKRTAATSVKSVVDTAESPKPKAQAESAPAAPTTEAPLAEPSEPEAEDVSGPEPDHSDEIRP